MKHIWLSTMNDHKRAEFETLLTPLGITLHTPHELDHFPAVDEVGETFAENALLKAQALYAIVREPVIADDSGLIVDALDGKPGIFSARYAGEAATDADNRQLLLKNMAQIDNRNAQFICSIALVETEDVVHIFEGQVKGSIMSEEQGTHGFGYDSLFFSEELGKTFAQATQAERNQVSHRARAFNKLRAKLNT